MKLIKVVVVKNLKTKNSFYSVLELRSFKGGCSKQVGNLIRSYLIKNIL